MVLSARLEIIALIIIFVVMLYQFDSYSKFDKRHRLFNLCLITTFVEVVVDLITTLCIGGRISMPYEAEYAVNILYFLVLHMSFGAIALYGCALINEHADNSKAGRYSTYAVLLPLAAVEALVISNPLTHLFFYYDENMVYTRGPLNKIGIVLVVFYLAIFFMNYFRNIQTVTSSMSKLLQMLVPLGIVTSVVQMVVPDILIVSVTLALSDMICFISFQSSRVGQDSLTELSNRTYFFHELNSQQRYQQTQHVVMVSIEQFSSINQRFGINAGDKLLYTVSRYLEHFAPKYHAYRFGNTRFVLLGPGKNEALVEVLMLQLLDRFKAPWTIDDDQEVELTVKIGHIIVGSNNFNPNDVLNKLEYAVAEARYYDGNSLIFFNENLNRSFVRQYYVLDEIKYALDHDTFELYYQPVYNCNTGNFDTAEALLRLVDRSGTSLSPGEFIPLAEQNNLIDRINWMVFDKAVRFLSQHPALPLKTISVNMTLDQLTDRLVFHRIHECLKKYDVDASRLRIEITERTISESPDLVRAVMTQLTAEGMKFYLDDFGIGYSNIASMMTFPFETVKLDASLVHGIDGNERSYHTLKLLAQMLSSADFIVVAEGIETSREAMRACEMPIDRIQGFFYAKPMPGEELLEFLDTRIRKINIENHRFSSDSGSGAADQGLTVLSSDSATTAFIK